MIRLQLTEDEENNTKSRIYQKFNFPGVIGFVDGTHIRMKCPEKTDVLNPELYYNRKGYHSINVMIVSILNDITSFSDNYLC